MTTSDDEDGLLRSVALQNAGSILIARQRAEQRREAYLAEAQRLSHTGSFGWSVSTGEILWSDETFRIFQYDRNDDADRGACAPAGAPRRRGGRDTGHRTRGPGWERLDFEHRLLMPDGSVKYVHVVAHAVRDESGSIEFVGAVMDVTEQHQARAALEEAFDEIKKSEDRLRLVIDTIPGMVWSGLPDGSFDFVNQPWLTYLGCSWEELSAQGGLVSVVHPDDVEGALPGGARLERLGDISTMSSACAGPTVNIAGFSPAPSRCATSRATSFDGMGRPPTSRIASGPRCCWPERNGFSR